VNTLPTTNFTPGIVVLVSTKSTKVGRGQMDDHRTKRYTNAKTLGSGLCGFCGRALRLSVSRWGVRIFRLRCVRAVRTSPHYFGRRKLK
jgi:hypothetical protein